MTPGDSVDEGGQASKDSVLHKQEDKDEVDAEAQMKVKDRHVLYAPHLSPELFTDEGLSLTLSELKKLRSKYFNQDLIRDYRSIHDWLNESCTVSLWVNADQAELSAAEPTRSDGIYCGEHYVKTVQGTTSVRGHPADVAFIHFLGHSAPGGHMLFGGSTLSPGKLIDTLKKVEPEIPVLLFMDTCYSGVLCELLAKLAKEGALGDLRIGVQAACRAGQLARDDRLSKWWIAAQENETVEFPKDQQPVYYHTDSFPDSEDLFKFVGERIL